MDKYSAYEEGFMDGYEEMIKEAAKAGLLGRALKGAKGYGGALKRTGKKYMGQRKKIKGIKKYYDKPGKYYGGDKAWQKKQKGIAKGRAKKEIAGVKKKGLGLSAADKRRLRNLAIGGGVAGAGGAGAAGGYLAGRD